MSSAENDIDWTGYEAFSLGVDRPLDEVDRADAREHFKLYVAAIPERRPALEGLLRRNGVELTSDEAGLEALNGWYVDHVRGDPEAMRLESWWYVVTTDISMWLGSYIQERVPHLEWQLVTSPKSDMSYQRPVLMGFRNVKNRKYNIDLELLVAGLGVRAVRGQREYDYFDKVVRGALRFA